MQTQHAAQLSQASAQRSSTGWHRDFPPPSSLLLRTSKRRESFTLTDGHQRRGSPSSTGYQHPDLFSYRRCFYILFFFFPKKKESSSGAAMVINHARRAASEDTCRWQDVSRACVRGGRGRQRRPRQHKGPVDHEDDKAVKQKRVARMPGPAPAEVPAPRPRTWAVSTSQQATAPGQERQSPGTSSQPAHRPDNALVVRPAGWPRPNAPTATVPRPRARPGSRLQSGRSPRQWEIPIPRAPRPGRGDVALGGGGRFPGRGGRRCPVAGARRPRDLSTARR